MAKSKKSAERKITILARYEIKKDHVDSTGKVWRAGWIVLLTVNDRGERHFVTLRTNGNSCDCKAAANGLACYHVKQCAQSENERSAKQKPVQIAALKEASIIASPRDYTSAEELIKKTSISSNKGFSLLAS